MNGSRSCYWFMLYSHFCQRRNDIPCFLDHFFGLIYPFLQLIYRFPLLICHFFGFLSHFLLLIYHFFDLIYRFPLLIYRFRHLIYHFPLSRGYFPLWRNDFIRLWYHFKSNENIHSQTPSLALFGRYTLSGILQLL